MVIFQYNLYIFGIRLLTVLYPKPRYNEPCYKEVVVYVEHFYNLAFFDDMCRELGCFTKLSNVHCG